MGSEKKQVPRETIEEITQYIKIHALVRDLQAKMKAAKMERCQLEKRLATTLASMNIDMLDVNNHRLYRYNERIIPYHLATE